MPLRQLMPLFYRSNFLSNVHHVQNHYMLYRLTENGEALMPIFDDIQNYTRRQSCGDCCKQETRHACCE